MKVYLATIRENDWEAETYVIGVYYTKEKAEKACLNAIQEEMDMTFLSLEVYDSMVDDFEKEYLMTYIWDIEEMEVQ